MLSDTPSDPRKMFNEGDPRELSDASLTALDAFVGQVNVVRAVKIALDAARNDNTRFPHALFTGPPGLGKSSLVQIIAHELGLRLQETLGQAVKQANDLSVLLLDSDDREILFLDEADEISTENQTLLLRAMAERRLFLSKGRAASAARSLALSNFTLILATNHEARLARALVDRFKLVCRFDYYSAREIETLLANRTDILGWQVEECLLHSIAARSRGSPRTGLRLLESVHRVARSERASQLQHIHFQRMCEVEGIDDQGLDRLERLYLQILQDERRPLRVGMIADRLGLPLRTVSASVEPYLVRQGLINRTDEGRQLSHRGIEYLGKAKAISL